MLYIQNVSFAAIQNGLHFDCGPNSILIQIKDPKEQFPIPKHTFESVYQFTFVDEDDENKLDTITVAQAKYLVEILCTALENKQNVIVHCVAGICRSGAVAEVGIMMGFNDTNSFRIPNSLVKRRMMKALGWTYDDA